MKEIISTQPVSNEADANGLNVLDRQKRQYFSHQTLNLTHSCPRGACTVCLIRQHHRAPMQTREGRLLNDR